MKLCLLCLRPSPDEHQTCLSCGEATWQPLTAEAVIAEGKALPAQATRETVITGRRAGKKNGK